MSYRLKHVATGQYLGVIDNQFEGRLEWVMSEKRKDEHNLFVFLPIDQVPKSLHFIKIFLFLFFGYTINHLFLFCMHHFLQGFLYKKKSYYKLNS